MEVISNHTFSNMEKRHPRLHAKAVDKLLGYKISKIEVKLLQKYRAYDRDDDASNRKQHYKGTQTWIGLHPQALQTPYCDIYDALKKLDDAQIDHVVDIGAGYGRVGLVLSVLRPEAKFTGYEIVRPRQVEGNRVFSKLGLHNSEIELRNVLESDFQLPEADVYFIYDFSEREDLFLILEQLSRKVLNKKFYLIMRGDRVDHLMKHNFNHIWQCSMNLHSSDLKIYTSKDV